jgi:hypothetical protein
MPTPTETRVERVGLDLWDVYVPTEKGDTCVVSMRFDPYKRVWLIEVSEELLYGTTEAITATINMALIAIKNHNFRDSDGD